jgi:hypothetical protein
MDNGQWTIDNEGRRNYQCDAVSVFRVTGLCVMALPRTQPGLHQALGRLQAILKAPGPCDIRVVNCQLSIVNCAVLYCAFFAANSV